MGPRKPADPETIEAAAGHRPLLSSLLGFRLTRLADRISRGASLVYETEFGISNIELRVLIVLSEDQPLSINELSRRANSDKGWISRSTRSLETRGLISRQAHASDSRVSLLSLTEKGTELIDRIIPVAKERHRRMMGDLPPDEVERVLAVLERHVDELLGNP